jgi:short subunit dehydrogenase-like uncharacterized protein
LTHPQVGRYAANVATNGGLIAVFGATGYTGRLIAHELRRHELPLLLAGRDAGKLAALAAQLGGAETAVASVADRASLDALARRARVLINCVGPFVDLGEPVVRAAIAAGAHYLDTTGEQPFLRAVLVHDTWAKTQNVAVVPAAAFEIALGDCGAAVAAAGLDEVDSVQITYVTRLHASQGTKRTALRMLQSEGLAYVNGAWVAEPPARRHVFVELPRPVGTVAAVSFPSAEVISVPRHVPAREVRTYLSLPTIAARLLSATAPVMHGLARSPLAGLGTWLLGSGTEGPDEATRRRDVFHIAVDARGRRRDRPTGQRIVIRGRDPYGLTAAICRQAAALLLAGQPRATGVLAPAMAFEPRRFLDGLASEGVAYEMLPLR